MKLRSMLCVIALSVGAAACNGTPAGDENTVGMNEEFTDETVGTTGDAETAVPGEVPASPAGAGQDTSQFGQDADRFGQSANQAGQDRGFGGQQDRAQLPATASPLGLAALIGLLSLGGAAGIRFLRQ